MMKWNKAYTFFVILVLSSLRCKKLVEVPSPVTELTSDNVYINDATASAVLTGIYTEMSAGSPIVASVIPHISLVAGLSADELSLYGGASNSSQQLSQFYLDKLTSGSSTGPGFSIWNDFYSKLYIVNKALGKLSASGNLTLAVKQQLTGEAKFLRAFFYFYLVNLFGDVPLTSTSDYTINAVLSRSPRAQIYQQIIADLKDAQKLLGDGYVASDAKSSTLERVRPNKWAAMALLARAYLYNGAYDSAETQATSVINKTALYETTLLNNTFLKNSKEAIWQLQPVNNGWNTEDARVFLLPSTGPTATSNFPVYLSPQLLNSFELGDQRRVNWVDSIIVGTDTFYCPFKYKSAKLNNPVTEYLTVLRLGEQYLIRAEARAVQNNISGAQTDLNTIRTRAGLAGTLAADRTALLLTILHERQVELFTEWGHRWLDLKRTGSIDMIMNAVASAKGTNWNNNWQWWPLPLYDITQDPNLVQNPGY